MAHFIYQFGPAGRPELATDLDAWTDDDNDAGRRHWEYLSEAAAEGKVILAGRSPDGVGPAIVVFEAEDEESAERFMEGDPFIAEGLFRGTLHTFRAALIRGDGG